MTRTKKYTKEMQMTAILTFNFIRNNYKLQDTNFNLST